MHGGSVHVAATGAVDHIDHLGPAVARHLQAGCAGIHAGVEYGHGDPASVIVRVLLKKT